MGFYEIMMGKGVILSTRVICELFGGLEDIKTLLGPKYSVVALGHDAFKSRDGEMNVLQGIPDIKKQLDSILSWRGQDSPDLCFLGVCQVVESADLNEFEYAVSTSELLYGLPALLPSIMSLYPRLEAEPCTELIKACPEYTPRIWTFASDCHCCT